MSLAVRLTMPGHDAKTVPLSQSPMVIGQLLSNHIVLEDSGVEPIHALLEQEDDGDWIITDLGSENGVKVNGRTIDVVQKIKVGDVVEIGSALLTVTLPAKHEQEAVVALSQMMFGSSGGEETSKSQKLQEEQHDSTNPGSRKGKAIGKKEGKTVSSPEKLITGSIAEAPKKDLLFSPREAKPSGDVLEVVAYWGNTILEVEHFHPSMSGYTSVTIGDPTRCHFIAAGPEQISHYTLAKVKDDGYKLYLQPQMSARLRRAGKVQQVEGGSHTIGRRDISHVKYGAVRYFFLFMRPPSINLPKTGPRDPFLLSLISLAMIFFSFFSITLWTMNPQPEKELDDDIWSIVHVPEKLKKIKKEEQKLAEVKQEPPPSKVPPPPKPKPVEPVKLDEKEKPKPPEPQKQEVKPKMTDTLTKAPTQDPPKPLPPDPKPAPVAKAPSGPIGGDQRRMGGPRGGGNNQAGGARQGDQKLSIKGVEGVDNDKSAGVNLKKLGLGVGKISSHTSAGAIATKFQSSAGGAGGGSGSASKTYGLGGLGSSVKSLGLAGSGSASNSFGSGSGGILDGKGGAGAGLGKAFGGGRRPAQVNVSAGDPLVSGGLSSQEILGAIRANLNQIRHCYEKLLQRSPNAAGKITVNFVIANNGRVSSAQVTQSSISDGEMQGCVSNAVRRWAFPRPRGGSPVTVNYPFTFNPI